MDKPRTAEELKGRINAMVEYMEKCGVLRRLPNGGLQIFADRFEFGLATHESGTKGLYIHLKSDIAKIEEVFVVTDRVVLAQMARTIDQILQGDKDVV